MFNNLFQYIYVRWPEHTKHSLTETIESMSLLEYILLAELIWASRQVKCERGSLLKILCHDNEAKVDASEDLSKRSEKNKWKTNNQHLKPNYGHDHKHCDTVQTIRIIIISISKIRHS